MQERRRQQWTLRVWTWWAGLVLVLGMSFVGSLAAESGLSSNGGKTNVLVLGDSLAAGFGVEPSLAFPARLQRKIDAAGIPAVVINAGLSGDTTAGGLRRLEWLLKRPVDVLVLELGGNDGLRGLPPEATRSNLVSIIERTRQKNPKVRVVLAGMQMPPNLGEDYVAKFRKVFPEVAQEQKAVLIPFLLEGVGGVPSLNQPDLIHPTAEGHAIVASNVWVRLEPVLRDPPPH